MNKIPRRFLKPGGAVAALCLLLGWLLAASSAPASSAPAPPAAPPPIVPAALADPGEFTRQLDGFITSEMDKRHIPGAVFVLVKDGKIFYLKGYGYASLESRQPVDPETTLFRAGSISKVFTATAAMQLAERGQLDLHADVNRYLTSFRVPDAFGQPVTMDALLTHTAGFAEYLYGQHVLAAAELQPLGQYLARRLPPRVKRPGEVFSYSDHGMSLAGHVVEEVSGLPYANFVERNIFRPLGMARSTFRQPVPPEWRPHMATGYTLKDSRPVPEPLDFCLTVPAACLVTTGTDAARFMIAQLQKGASGDARILAPASAEELQRRHFAQHPLLRGRAYGFAESFQNNRRALFHDGGMSGFLSRLYLEPEGNWGFFVSYNCWDMGFKHALTQFVLDRVCPVKEDFSGLRPFPGARRDLAGFGGYYRQVEGLGTTLAKLKYLEDQLPVAAAGDRLRIFGETFVEVEPLFFRSLESGEKVAFQLDPAGKVKYLFVGSGAFERVEWYETPTVQMGILVFFSLVFASILLAWPLRALARRLRRQTAAAPSAVRLGRGLAFLYSLFSLASLAGTYLFFAHVMENYFDFMRGYVFWLNACLVLNLVNLPLAAGLVVFATVYWRQKSVRVGERVHWLFLALAAIAQTGFLAYWNLLGFRY